MSHEKRPFRVLDRRVSELNAKKTEGPTASKNFIMPRFLSHVVFLLSQRSGDGQYDRYAENYSLNKDNFNLPGSGNLHSTLEPATDRSIGIL